MLNRSPVRFKGVMPAAYDVTVINENRIAVSNPGQHTISTIDVNMGKVKNTSDNE